MADLRMTLLSYGLVLTGVIKLQIFQVIINWKSIRFLEVIIIILYREIGFTITLSSYH